MKTKKQQEQYRRAQEKYKKNHSERIKKQKKRYELKYPEKVKEQQERYRKKHKEYYKEYSKKYYKENKEEILEKQRQYRENNCERCKSATKEWAKKNSGRVTELKRNWQKTNKEKVLRIRRHKRKINSRFRLRCNISSSISSRLKLRLSSKKGKSIWNFLPYTVDELIQHLEKLFTEGMTWQNYGKWHIDHKRPDCNFDYKSVEDDEFQKCWALKNLQPLWAIDNQKKGDKLI